MTASAQNLPFQRLDFRSPYFSLKINILSPQTPSRSSLKVSPVKYARAPGVLPLLLFIVLFFIHMAFAVFPPLSCFSLNGRRLFHPARLAPGIRPRKKQEPRSRGSCFIGTFKLCCQSSG
jgi:hypothetical protein